MIPCNALVASCNSQQYFKDGIPRALHSLIMDVHTFAVAGDTLVDPGDDWWGALPLWRSTAACAAAEEDGPEGHGWLCNVL